MLKWPALKWMKALTILLLLFLNGYLFYRLLPLLGTVLHFFLRVAFPFAVAGIIAYLLHPLIKRLSVMGVPRTIAILGVYVLFFSMAGLLLFKGGPAFIHELRGLNDEFVRYQKMYQSQVDHVYGSTPEAVHDQVNKALARIQHATGRFADRLMDWCTGFIQSLFTLIIIPFLAFYFLKDSEKIKRGALHLIPRKWRNQWTGLFTEMDQSIGLYIRGQLTVCAILAVLASIGLWILKVRYPIVFGVFIGLTDLIPYFGPLIGAAPAVLMAATQSFYAVIGVVLMIFLIQFLEGNVIEPLVVGKSVDIHPLYIMLSLGVGGEIAGIVGMLLAIPCFIVIRIGFIHMKKRLRVIDK
ncbi:AI-2E family transporter [Sporolactobacillus sp. Y61]|uniref:AI-2E family transporter n=1 Tax=Sporolactobacillus sp. Y61 TaxID=3160863 RepID=A0AAU8IF00_9BACL|nr:AI-2E family transporter [Sporolactobacillus sp. THM19-2]RYL94736.1 AI-2E family transporter [Sporolactobacillus sp. THM19-2]